jgi:UDP-glucose 4-epimerase
MNKLDKIFSQSENVGAFATGYPGEPDCTFADVGKIKHLLGCKPKVRLEGGVQKMIEKIKNWKTAPVWDSSSIKEATTS